MPLNPIQQKAKDFPRVSGAILLSISIFLLYEGIYSPYLQMQEHISEVSFSLSAIVIGIVGVFLSLVLLIFGSRYAHQVFMTKEERSAKQTYILYSVIAVATISIMIALHKWVQANGYNGIF